MAEAWLNNLHGEYYEAFSAGIEPGQLNPLVVRSMAEVGIDIANHQTQAVSDVISQGINASYLITVCDGTSAERCPSIPGLGNRLHWNFTHPSILVGSDDEKLIQIRVIRDQIKDRIQQWGDERKRTEVAE